MMQTRQLENKLATDGVIDGENGYRDDNGDVTGSIWLELPRQPRHREAQAPSVSARAQASPSSGPAWFGRLCTRSFEASSMSVTRGRLQAIRCCCIPEYRQIGIFYGVLAIGVQASCLE